MPASLQSLEIRLGYQFVQSHLLKVALTHRSFHFENSRDSGGHFERMEFLGDAVLDLLLSEELMRLHPQADEGTLSKWRASLVNEIQLAEMAKQLTLGDYLFLGRSEDNQRALLRPRLLASAFEAVVAAIYLDGGIEPVRAFVLKEFNSLLSSVQEQGEYFTDYKTRLQEWAQKRYQRVPEYRLVNATGPDHAKRFRFSVWLEQKELGEGEGSSRKSAEQEAARIALALVNQQNGEIS